MTGGAGLRVEFDVHFTAGRRGRKRAVVGERPAGPDVLAGRLPRVTPFPVMVFPVTVEPEEATSKTLRFSASSIPIPSWRTSM